MQVPNQMEVVEPQDGVERSSIDRRGIGSRDPERQTRIGVVACFWLAIAIISGEMSVAR